jgi:hypothetical protein
MRILSVSDLQKALNQTLARTVKSLVKDYILELFPDTYALSFTMTVRDLTIMKIQGPFYYGEGDEKSDNIVKLELVMHKVLLQANLTRFLADEFYVMPNETDKAPAVFGFGDDYVGLKLYSSENRVSHQDLRMRVNDYGIDIESYQFGVKTGHVGVDHFDDTTCVQIWSDPHNIEGDPSTQPELHRYKLRLVQKTSEVAQQLEYVRKNDSYDLDDDSLFLDLLDTGDFAEVRVLDSKTYYIVHESAL